MNLLHLRYFYEVARTKSFMETSRNLRISQPAISKMVRLLEEDLGRMLFERSRKGVRLTEQGEILFETASRIFSEAEAGREKLLSDTEILQGSWSFGVSDNIALYLIPEVLGKFKEKHSKLKISLFSGTSTQIKTELQADRCRLGIFYTPPKASEPFEFKKIHETEFWIVIAKKNRWLKRTSMTLEDLKKVNVPRIESRHSDYSSVFPAHFHSNRLGLTESPWLEVNQHEIKKKLVLGGFGFALLTKHTVEKEVKEGLLSRVRSPLALPAPIYAVWRKERMTGRVSDEFLRDFTAFLNK